MITLSSITLFCCCSATAAEIVASGTCGAEGDNLTWKLDDAGMLTIDGAGEMKAFSSFNNHYAPWYSHRTIIKTVILEEGLNNISNYAFIECINLKSVIMPKSLTSIDNWAFYNCSSLTDFSIPNSVIYIGSDAFCKCTSLTRVCSH